MTTYEINRREFLRKGMATIGFIAAFPVFSSSEPCYQDKKHIVSVVRIKNDRIEYAVEYALDLLGGISKITQGKERIMIKPNLVTDNPDLTTKPTVVQALGRLFKREGKEVFIGEGSSYARGFNFKNDIVYRTRRKEILDAMQQYVFDQLGYTDLSKRTGIPLINLHIGEMVDIEVKDAIVFKNISLNYLLSNTDMLCSVPIMKTHVLATVSLGMKNLIGLYPGTVYCCVRSCLHQHANLKNSPGIAYEIVDIVRASKLGLTVIDASMALEGNAKNKDNLIKMDLIIAGTNPLATDMVAASIMGFDIHEIPTFTIASRSGMKPSGMDEIEVRGEKIENVKRNFAKPEITTWKAYSDSFGAREI